ncbi:unnamed protein product, partial [Didymodactylos carnosus]
SIIIKCTEQLDGASTNNLKKKHTPFGENEIPSLAWTVSEEDVHKIKEFALIVQDADVPMPSPILHGLYYSIPSSCRSLTHSDLLSIKNDDNEAGSGMKYGLNFRKNLYSGARPIVNHGQHRYFYQLVGLERPVGLPGGVSLPQLINAMQGKIIAYGVWIGVYERLLHEDD